MGGQIINFSPKEAAELELLKIQNAELQNQTKLLGRDLENGMSGLIAAAQSQFNITSFNPLFQSNIVAPLTLNYTFLTYFYKTHGIIQRAVQMPVQDALRGGMDFHSKEMNEDDITEFTDFLEENGVNLGIETCMTWARLFGGGAMIVNDGGKFDQPLTPDQPIRFLKFYPASRWELGSPTRLGQDGIIDDKSPWEAAAAASSEFYNYYGQKLHKSRVIPFIGKEAPWMVRWMLQGWGMSEVERIVEDFNLYVRTRNVLYDLLNEAKVDVFMIDGMRELLMTDAGTQKMLTRIQTVQQAKNMNNALLLDKNDLYEQKQLTFSSIAEVMKENKMAIASAIGMPISKLFGVASSGFSSGEDDIENYNAMVESDVRGRIRRPMRQIYDLCQRFLWGQSQQYTMKFKPLRVMSAKDEEEIRAKKFDRVMVMYDHGLMTSKEVGEACHKDTLISVDTLAQAGKLEDFPENPQQLNTPEEKPEPKAGKEK